MEIPEYINTDDHQNLYSVFYEPEDRKNNSALIILDSLFEEKLWSQRVLVNLARFLSGSGYSVIRFDHTGHGESTGWYKDVIFDDYLNDLNNVIRHVKQNKNVDKIYLLGLRFGSLTALIYAGESENQISGCILLEPALNVNDFIMECLRSNLTTQMVLYKKVKYSREVLLEKLTKGDMIDIDGYELTLPFFESVRSRNISDKKYQLPIPAVMMKIIRNTNIKTDKALLDFIENYNAGIGKIYLEKIISEPFWMETRKLNYHPFELFEKVENWLPAD